MNMLNHITVFHITEFLVITVFILLIVYLFLNKISNYARKKILNLFNVYTNIVKMLKISEADFINIYKYNYNKNKNFITSKLLLIVNKKGDILYNDNQKEYPATINQFSIDILNIKNKGLNELYNSPIYNDNIGYARHKIILDDNNNPIDYVFLETNKKFEELTGLKDVLNRKVTEVIPDFKNEKFDWISLYGDIAINQETKKFKMFSNKLNKKYMIVAFSDEKYYFTTIFTKAGDKKNIEIIENQQNSYKAYVRKIFNNNIPLGYITLSYGKEYKITEYQEQEISKLIDNIKKIIV
jgi:hypothetical protein